MLMTQILIKPTCFSSTARHSSTSKRSSFDQIPSYHVVYPVNESVKTLKVATRTTLLGHSILDKKSTNTNIRPLSSSSNSQQKLRSYSCIPDTIDLNARIVPKS